MEQKSPAKKQLVRDAKREALERLEEAARTVEQFRVVVKHQARVDANRERRERRYEVGRVNEEVLYWSEGRGGTMKAEFGGIVPRPYNHDWWRQLLRGDFLDYIHDCPYEMHQLTTSNPLFEILQTLNENQLEVLFLRAIRQYSPQRIGKMRGQTDRNILKVYATLIAAMRKKMYTRLAPRYDEDLPLTINQKRFVEDYRAGRLKTGKPKFDKGKKKHRP